MLTLGGYLKKKENLSARLGDVLSSMYLASMVLKHHENQGRPADDLPLVEWACRNQLYHAQEQLHDFLRNFPNRFLAGVMRLFIFPGGRTYFAPSDRLGRQLADAVLNPTEVRDRLCRFVYRTLEPGNPLGLLQEALMMSQTAEPIEKRIRVEGVKTGKVTALDVPGQITQALRARHHFRDRGGDAARVRPQGHGPHQRRRLRDPRTGRRRAVGGKRAGAGERHSRSPRARWPNVHDELADPVPVVSAPRSVPAPADADLRELRRSR